MKSRSTFLLPNPIYIFFGILGLSLVVNFGVLFFVSKPAHDLLTTKYYDEALDYQKQKNSLENFSKKGGSVNLDFKGQDLTLKISGVEENEGTIAFINFSNDSKDFELPFKLKQGVTHFQLTKQLQGKYWIKIFSNNHELLDQKIMQF